jgi:hypothetical protein
MPVAHVILAAQETKIKRIEVQSQSGQIVQETLSYVKRAGRMVQVVECLPRKCKAPNSSSSTAKNIFIYTFREVAWNGGTWRLRCI